jgi:hypothetical protein
MALTITYDGYGVVANADSLTNDTGGSGTGDWKELGGGSYSLSPDASKYGVASIGSKYASKSGYTYIDGITPLDYSGGGAQEGEFIYIWVMTLSPTPLKTIANTPYNICIGDGTGSFNEYTVASKSDSNKWDGRWRVFCIDPTTTPTINGGADLSAIDTIGVWMDTDVSVRAESFFISQIISAKGLKVEGTSTTMYDDIVLWAEDYANRAAGMFQSRGQTYFSLGSLTIHSDTANTTVSSDGSNVEYEKSEHYSGSAWVTSYPTTANVITVNATGGNTASMTDTNIGLAGNDSNKVSIDTSSATGFTKSGGYIKYLSTMSSTANDEYSGVVISLYDARTLGAEPYNKCTFDGSNSLTLTASSDFANNNIINGVSGVTSMIVADLAHISTSSINSSGSNHGVELTTVGDGTMDWNCLLSNFDSGSTGSPITPTSTGNEAIYISATSGEVTISVATGAGIPSIRSAGATVNVVAGQVTTTITVRDKLTKAIIQNAMVYVWADAGGGLTEGTVIINKLLTDVNGQVSDTRSLSSNQPVLGRARKSTVTPFYKTEPIGETIDSANGLSLTLYLILDE